MRKYYIEFVFDSCNSDIHCDLQSIWFDTEEEALKWCETFAVKENCLMVLMSMPYDENKGFYGNYKEERIVK